MNGTIDNYIGVTDEYELKCPKCHETFLHHGKIEIFSRKEDEVYGLHTIVESDKKIDIGYDKLENNPSSRRDGIRIFFDCEFCEDTILCLSISQHKGQTLVLWEEI